MQAVLRPPLCQTTWSEREPDLLAQSMAASVKLCTTSKVKAKDTFRAANSFVSFEGNQEPFAFSQSFLKGHSRGFIFSMALGRLPLVASWSSLTSDAKCWEVYSLSAMTQGISQKYRMALEGHDQAGCHHLNLWKGKRFQQTSVKRWQKGGSGWRWRPSVLCATRLISPSVCQRWHAVLLPSLVSTPGLKQFSSLILLSSWDHRCIALCPLYILLWNPTKELCRA